MWTVGGFTSCSITDGTSVVYHKEVVRRATFIRRGLPVTEFLTRFYDAGLRICLRTVRDAIRSLTANDRATGRQHVPRLRVRADSPRNIHVCSDRVRFVNRFELWPVGQSISVSAKAIRAAVGRPNKMN